MHGAKRQQRGEGSLGLQRAPEEASWRQAFEPSSEGRALIDVCFGNPAGWVWSSQISGGMDRSKRNTPSQDVWGGCHPSSWEVSAGSLEGVHWSLMTGQETVGHPGGERVVGIVISEDRNVVTRVIQEVRTDRACDQLV